MADKKKKKGKSKKKAASTPLSFGANSMELSHKIWLAGVGAYGKAYDTALEGANIVNKKSAKLFDELVQHGEEMEGDLRDRLTSDETLSKAGASLTRVTEAAEDFQVQARHQFEDRMARMRDILSATPLGDVSERLMRQLDKIEGEVSELTEQSRARNEDVRARLARLTSEIESVATETGSDMAKTAKKAAGKTTKAVKTAIAPAKNNKSAKKAQKADDLTKITGVGPALEKKLHDAGMTTFAQIAQLSKADIADLDSKIGARGRIQRDNWVKQAKALSR